MFFWSISASHVRLSRLSRARGNPGDHDTRRYNDLGSRVRGKDGGGNSRTSTTFSKHYCNRSRAKTATELRVFLFISQDFGTDSVYTRGPLRLCLSRALLGFFHISSRAFLNCPCAVTKIFLPLSPLFIISSPCLRALRGWPPYSHGYWLRLRLPPHMIAFPWNR